jgi:hypothetical protein
MADFKSQLAADIISDSVADLRRNQRIAYGWPNARSDLSRTAVDFKESLGRRQRFGKVGRTGDD